MRFSFLSPLKFEDWDWRNPTTPGIGGSETSHIEMACRLAARGHQVVSYSPLPADCPDREYGGVTWRHLDECLYSEPGIWCLYRCPAEVAWFNPQRDDQRLWLVCQDEDYVPTWRGKDDQFRPRRDQLHRVIALCRAQREQFEKRYPDLKGRVYQSSNGIKGDLIQATLAEGLPRHPKRILYASSPDRGLMQLLWILNRVREFDPEFELVVAYGFDNIDKIIAQIQARPEAERGPIDQQWLQNNTQLRQALQSPGVRMLGRLGQPELYRQWAQAGMWVYCTNFRETSCITSMESQALGAIPVVSPVWAVEENVRHGVMVEGDAGCPDTLTRFAAEVLRLGNDLATQKVVRQDMMPEVLSLFLWERWVEQWEAWALEEPLPCPLPQRAAG